MGCRHMTPARRRADPPGTNSAARANC